MKEVNYFRGAESGKVGWKLNTACEPSNLRKVDFIFILVKFKPDYPTQKSICLLTSEVYLVSLNLLQYFHKEETVELCTKAILLNDFVDR